MVNRYTSDRRLRHNDSYTPHGEGGRRPDRAVIVYAQRCREAFADAPIVIGGIEASLRRIAHYDYWSDKIRRSILLDSKADLLLYGNAERALVEVAHRIAKKGVAQDFSDIRGLAILRVATPEGWTEAHAEDLDGDEGVHVKGENVVVRLPAYEQVVAEPEAYARASRVLHKESNPGNARPLVAKTRRQGHLADRAAHSVDHAGNGRRLWPALCPRAASFLRGRENPGLGDDPPFGDDHARLFRRLLLLLDHRTRGPHHPEPVSGTRF